ncbi:MAG: hypothetical protein Q7R91_00485, partial [bacterium]|nr:hypothetical protein [bacterium]
TASNGFDLDGGCFSINGACIGGTASGWTPSGSNVVLTTITDFVGIGTATPWGQLSVNPNGITSTAMFAVGSSTATQFVVSNKNGSYGNVGIGTTSPFALLSVDAPAGQASFAVGSTTATHFIINQQGKVGIGTSGPQRKLDVFSVDSVAQFRVSQSLSNYTEFQTDSVGDLIVSPQGGNVRLNDYNLYVCSGGACPAGSPAGTGNLIVETRLGVGTSTPNWNLQVAGTRPFFVLSDTGGAGLNLKHWTFSSQNGNLYVATSTDIYATSTLPAFMIDSNGNIGVGTANPSSRFSVAGIIESIIGGFKFPDATLQTTAATSTTGFVGLHLRTHPDFDISTTTVDIVHADEIQLDNGVKVNDWNNVTAAITASGAGGLDTGSEAASTWYEIYAIYNGTTKSVLLHQAKDYFLDEQQTTNNSSVSLRLASSNERLAEDFQVDTAGKVEFVDVTAIRSGSVTGNIWLQVEADSSGSPSGTALATSDKIDASLVSTSAQSIRFVFRNPVSLSALTTYHLVFYGSYPLSDVNTISWSLSTTDTYARGTRESFTSSSWSDTSTQDFVFKIYVTRNDTAITMPSGYTGKAKIGYVFNDSGSNFLPIVKVGRTTRKLSVLTTGATTATVPTLTDLSTFIPPGPYMVQFGTIDTTDNATMYINGVPDGYPPNSGAFSDGHAESVHSGGGAATQPRIVTDYQAVYIFVSSGTGNAYVLEYSDD